MPALNLNDHLDIELDSVLALLDLCARTGARQCEIGYLDDDVPIEKARWYAQARYRGALLMADERSGPDEACDALARRLLAGARCTACNRFVTLGEFELRYCRWHREGPAWVRGCDGKREATRKRKES